MIVVECDCKRIGLISGNMIVISLFCGQTVFSRTVKQ